MYHLLKDIDEEWRGLILSTILNQPHLKEFLNDYSKGVIEEQILPRLSSIFDNYKEYHRNFSVVLVTTKNSDRTLQIPENNVFKILTRPTYSRITEKDHVHSFLWEEFIFRIVRYLQDRHHPVFIAVGKDSLKPFFTLPKEQIVTEESYRNISFDIQYKTIVLQTEKITEDTISCVNYLLKLKKQNPLKI